MLTRNMQKVTVKKLDLLLKLRTNKDKHVAEFNEAIAGYRKEVVTYLGNLVNLVNDGKDINHHINVDKPTSFEKEYNRAIAMLEMSVDETIELDADTFNKYVLDEWDWKDNFAMVSAKYLSSR